MSTFQAELRQTLLCVGQQLVQMDAVERTMAQLSRQAAAVVPVHLKGGALPESNAQEAVPFKRFTIANLKPQSELEGISIYWLHFTLAYVFVFYSLWLMNYHYEVRSSTSLVDIAYSQCNLQPVLECLSSSIAKGAPAMSSGHARGPHLPP